MNRTARDWSPSEGMPAGAGRAARAFGSRVLVLAVAAVPLLPAPLLAQTTQRLDSSGDAQDARTDALLGTLNLETPEPLSNLYSTAPGLEQQLPAPQWRFNLLAPLTFDSSAEQTSQGGTQTLGTSPFGGVSWAAPVANLPFRVTVNANSELNRYFDASDADNDRLTVSGRVQYVDPANDQAFSPYFAIAPRWEYLPTFSEQVSARQDFNLGFNKRFNFDDSFHSIPIAADTSAETVWSFGLTAFVQRRLREPQLSSSALFVIPSVSYIISKDWNASFAVEFLGRWFDPNAAGELEKRPGGVADRDPRIRDPDLIPGRRQNGEYPRPARARFARLVSQGLVEHPWRHIRPMGSPSSPQDGLALLTARTWARTPVERWSETAKSSGDPVGARLDPRLRDAACAASARVAGGPGHDCAPQQDP